MVVMVVGGLSIFLNKIQLTRYVGNVVKRYRTKNKAKRQPVFAIFSFSVRTKFLFPKSKFHEELK